VLRVFRKGLFLTHLCYLDPNMGVEFNGVLDVLVVLRFDGVSLLFLFVLRVSG